MNLNFIGLGAAIAVTATAATVMGSAPAQAIGLTGVLNINLGGQVNSVRNTGIDFNNNPFALQNSPGSSLSGSFASYVGGTVTIKDLAFPSPLISGGTPVNVSLPISSFITLQKGGLPTLTFDLISLIAADFDDIGQLGDSFGNFNARLRGTFQPSGLPNQQTIDSLVAFRQFQGSNFGSIELTPVPTPALVPAALGFGAAMLRKRKGEKAEKEAAGAKA